MFNNILKEKKGNANAIPMIIIITATFAFSLFAFYNSISSQIYNFNVRKYENAIDTATKIGFMNIDFSTQRASYVAGNDVDKNLYAEQILSLGGTLEIPSSSSSTTTVENVLRLRIDTTKFTSDFYDVLFQNLGISALSDKDFYKQFIKMKVILENDNIMISGPNDVWVSYPFAMYGNSTTYRGDYTDGVSTLVNLDTTNRLVYFTLDSQVYVVKDTDISHQLETNRLYLETPPTATSIRNVITQLTSNIIENYLNLTHTVSSESSIINLFNQYDEKTNNFVSSVDGIGFMCMIDGIPIKTYNSTRAFSGMYSLDLGSSGLTRKDLASKKTTI